EFSRGGSRWSVEKFGATFPLFFQSLRLLRWVVNGGLRFSYDNWKLVTKRIVSNLSSLIPC
ncbi:hypothetical protein LINPERPRIM_LOCUS652, partial [Linum perenne]